MLKCLFKWSYTRRQRKVTKGLIAQIGRPRGDFFQSMHKATGELSTAQYPYYDKPERKPIFRYIIIAITLTLLTIYFIRESLLGLKLFV